MPNLEADRCQNFDIRIIDGVNALCSQFGRLEPASRKEVKSLGFDNRATRAAQGHSLRVPGYDWLLCARRDQMKANLVAKRRHSAGGFALSY